MGIELPPLNAALIEVHRELAKVSIGAKDMAIKNKNVWKTVKQTQAELQKAIERIAEFERSVTTAWQAPSPTNNAENQSLREEVEAQTLLAVKAKRVVRLAESIIDSLHAQLRQSSDRETDIQAKGWRTIKGLDDKVTAESAAHALTKKANSKLREEASKMEGVNKGLREMLEKRKVCYNEQLEKE